MKTNPYHIGKAYLIRTVTMYYIGTLVSVGDLEIVLKDAVWIPDTGRFSNALKTGDLNEVEPFNPGEVIISRGAIVEASIWLHSVPKNQK